MPEGNFMSWQVNDLFQYLPEVLGWCHHQQNLKESLNDRRERNTQTQLPSLQEALLGCSDVALLACPTHAT